jgi:hypothetical protein
VSSRSGRVDGELWRGRHRGRLGAGGDRVSVEVRDQRPTKTYEDRRDDDEEVLHYKQYSDERVEVGPQAAGVTDDFASLQGKEGQRESEGDVAVSLGAERTLPNINKA